MRMVIEISNLWAIKDAGSTSRGEKLRSLGSDDDLQPLATLVAILQICNGIVVNNRGIKALVLYSKSLLKAGRVL